MQLKEAWAKSERIRLDIIFRSYAVGGVRRQDPLVDVIEIVIVIEPEDNTFQGGESDIARGLMSLIGLTEINSEGSASASGLFHGEPVKFYICDMKELGASMLALTGPTAYLTKCSEAAIKQKLFLNNFGLWHYRSGGEEDPNRHTEAYSEFHIMARIGMPYLDPFDRRTA